MSAPSTWVSAVAVYNLDMHGNRVVQWAADGLVQSRCRLLKGLKIPADADGRTPLPQAFWVGMLRRTGSEYRDWQGGTFRSGLRTGSFRDPEREVEAVKVEFLLSDVDDMTDGKMSRAMARANPDAALLDDQKPDSVASAATNRRGGRGRSAKWEEWIAYAVLAVHRGDIGGHMTDLACLTKIAELMAADGIDEHARSTVQGAMSKILEVLRADAAGN